MNQQQTFVLELENIHKKLGGKEIIKNISFKIKSGEIVGFLGPNGSGKTTTIRMITGMINPDKGTVIINGYNIQRDFSKAMMHIGAIVENPALYEYLSGWENLQQAARISGMSISKNRLHECVHSVRLDERIHEKVERYSLGMKQRLGIAQALLTSPRLLVLDEPTNGIDPSGIIEMRELIRKLREETGISVLISSHLLSEIEQLCDSIVIIENGSLLAVKELESIETHRFTLTLKPEQITQAVKFLETEGAKVSAGLSTLDLEANIEQIPSIVNSLYNHGFPIYLIEPKHQSLEQFFLDTTKGKGL